MDNKDAEDFQYMTSPEFWRMIEEARRMPTVPWEQVKEELLADAELVDNEGREKPLDE